MNEHTRARRALKPLYRALIEVGFIMFLFYANLLMGEYTRGNDRGLSLGQALADVVTLKNFVVGFIASIFGYGVFEYLRQSL